MSDEKTNDIEVRMLNAMRKTLISVAKDTMTKPGLRHPLTETTLFVLETEQIQTTI